MRCSFDGEAGFEIFHCPLSKPGLTIMLSWSNQLCFQSCQFNGHVLQTDAHKFGLKKPTTFLFLEYRL